MVLFCTIVWEGEVGIHTAMLLNVADEKQYLENDGPVIS